MDGMSLGELSTLIVAITGVIGIVLAHRLGLIGQRKDTEQQQAANKIAERIASFDELESLNDRLEKENARLQAEVVQLRALALEAESRGDLRLARQAGICRERLTEMSAVLTTMQAVVVSEIASASAQHELDLTSAHLETHPDETPDLT